MEPVFDKLWGVMVSILGALAGFFMYHHKKLNDRVSSLEAELSDHKRDIAVVKESLTNLKDDTQEIKELQNKIVDILVQKQKS